MDGTWSRMTRRQGWRRGRPVRDRGLGAIPGPLFLGSRARMRSAMRLLRIALAQIDTTVGDLEGNVQKVRSALARAESHGAELVAFPELTLPGYPPEDLLL